MFVLCTGAISAKFLQVPQGLPRGQSAGPPVKPNSALTPNMGSQTPGRYPAGPGNMTGRPPLASRGNEDFAVDALEPGRACE